MESYRLTPLAKSDVFQIWSYIAEDSEVHADKVEQEIMSACSFVARSPFLGHIRSDLTTGNLRFWTLPRYPSYTLVYRPDPRPVEIIAVLHGKRQLSRILRNRG